MTTIKQNGIYHFMFWYYEPFSGLIRFWGRNSVTEVKLSISKKYWIVGAGALCLMSGTTYLAIGISIYYLRKRKKTMSVQNLKKDIVLVIGLVHNGNSKYMY